MGARTPRSTRILIAATSSSSGRSSPNGGSHPGTVLVLLCRLQCISAGSPAPRQNQSLLEPVARGEGSPVRKDPALWGKMVDCREGVACGRSCGQGPWPERTSPEKWGDRTTLGMGVGASAPVLGRAERTWLRSGRWMRRPRRR